MKLRDDNVFKNAPLIIGIGPSAWPRIISSFYFPKFKILSFYDCLDNDFIEDFGIDNFSIKKHYPDIEISPVTPGQILQTKAAANYLARQKEPFVFLVYKSSWKLEQVCRENGWKLIANKRDLADYFENKKIFKEVLGEVGIESIPGESLLIDDLTPEKFVFYQKKLGQEKLVLQLAEMTYGGGSGTIFLDRAEDLPVFYGRVTELRKSFEGKKKQLLTVNVAPYIEATSASISCCATKFGILSGPIQTQIIDIPEVGTKIKGRSGNYAGQDWSYRHYSADYQFQVEKIAGRFGEFMFKKGYRGIFGLDLLIDEKRKKVWPMECNPRETDAFPLISFLQMEKGLTPFDVYHNLEHLQIDYEIDFEKENRAYKQDFEASQIILHNTGDQPAIIKADFRPGIYVQKDDGLEYSRSGFMFSDLKNEKEILITEGVGRKGQPVFSPSGRICRLIKRGGMIGEGWQLTEEFKKTVALVYRQMKLLPVEDGLKDDHGLKVLFVNKLMKVEENPELAKAEILNVISETGTGLRRPLKIAWRRKLEGEIFSKKMMKQIKADEKKLADLGIEVAIIPQIDQPLFEKWLEFYQKEIAGKKGGKATVGEDWLKGKRERGKDVGTVIATKDGEIVGGELFFEVGGRLSIGYGMAEKVTGLAGGLGMFLDYKFLEYAKSHGYSEVSFGQDTNLYGWDLSPGLIDYKLKLGFLPLPANKTYFVNTVFLKPEKLNGGIKFFTFRDNQPVLNEI